MILNKIKNLLPSLADDGSKEIAKQYIKTLEEEKSLTSLRENEGFKILLDKMKADFEDKLRDIVFKDNELKEIHKMYIRVMGGKGAEEEIEKHIKNFLKNEVEIS